MKIAVRYYTKTGNTKKLADAIAEATGVEAASVDTPVKEYTDVLFLGSSVYGASVDEEVKNFILQLRSDKVGQVVNFSTAALLPSTYKQVKKLLEQKNITVSEQEFHCRGCFKFMHKGKPDEEDLQKVENFVREVLS